MIHSPEEFFISCSCAGTAGWLIINLGSIVQHTVLETLTQLWEHDEIFPTNSFNSDHNDNDSAVLGSLVRFLVQDWAHRDLVIIHDHTSPDVTELVEGGFQNLRDTTILTITLDLARLQAILKTHRSTGLRCLLLLCSQNNTKAVFDMVRSKNLESWRERWVVVVEEQGMTNTLKQILREGTRVILAERVTQDHYQIFSSYVKGDDQVSFQPNGVWKKSIKKSQDKVASLSQLFPSVVELYGDFQGRHLIAASVPNWPFFALTILDNSTVLARNGIDVSILETLGQYLNFTYSVLKPADGQWGAVNSDGTVTGMVGEVAARRAHFAINEITITDLRETVVDFSYPYFTDTTAITSMAPTEKNRSLAVFYPFSMQVWLALILITLLMGPLAYLVSRGQVTQHPGQISKTPTQERPGILSLSFISDGGPEVKGLQMFSFNLFRTVVIQGNLLPARNWPLRLVFFSWYAFCLILYAVYSGTLTAYLTKPSFNKPLDTLEDVLTARERGVALSVSVGTSILAVFKTAESGLYKRAYDSMDPARSFPPNGIIGVKRVPRLNTAHLTGRVTSEIYAIQHGRDLYHISRDSFMPQQYGLATFIGSPFLPRINLMIGRMLQAGLVGKWHRDEMAKLQRGQDRSGGQEGGQGSVQVKPLGIDHLQGAFYFLFGLGLLASFTFLLEILTRLFK